MEKLPPLTGPLLAWYDKNRRRLPFREDPTPYHVWVSEVMLQQTQVATMLPYYQRFMAELPDVAALAACSEDRLHKLWQGLGYYSRARNLRRAAVQVMEQYGGVIPADYEALRSLPGIGEYTAGAIASIAFGLPCVAVDGNVLRVAARLMAFDEDVLAPGAKRVLAAAVAHRLPPQRPSAYNQALMELGALVCIPGAPRCAACPLAAMCEGRKKGIAAALPVKKAAAAKRTEEWCGLVVHTEGRVLLQRRPPKGLLAGLWQPPLLPGPLARDAAAQALQALLPAAQITGALPPARHVFTHRVWLLQGWRCALPPGQPLPKGAYALATPDELGAVYAVPSAFKAWRAAMAGEGDVIAENDTKSRL